MKKNIFLSALILSLIFACNTQTETEEDSEDSVKTEQEISISQDSITEINEIDSVAAQISEEATDLKEKSNEILEDLNN
ncbi:hypothetical protein OO013_18965 [Mangrovivirga sp. M17]|uniref:Lipoprotein n=1 Tax=Mangrovivirga halotolerans TaxID=2993936 RepID=A0ABT3RW15_9BACT|nr:hypothetical protein [Mangrovivirga halotolerans]MCX2745970.1 hypothetical protein [Mangrovivirga halotolerans]